MSVLYGGDDHIERKQDEIEDFEELVRLFNPEPAPERTIYDDVCDEHGIDPLDKEEQ